MRQILAALFFIVSGHAWAIYQGYEEKDPNGVRQFMVFSEVENKQVCSGVLIANDVFATSANCAMALGGTKFYILNKAFQKQELVPVHAILHPDYNGAIDWQANGLNNIGLVRIKQPLSSSPNLFEKILDIEINPLDIIFLSGFGRSENDNALSSGKLRSFAMPPFAITMPVLRRTSTQAITADNPMPSACRGDVGGGVFNTINKEIALHGMIVGYFYPTGTVPGTCGGTTIYMPFPPLKKWIVESIKELRERKVK
jgi:Trypsin